MVVGAIGSRTELAVIGAGPGGYVAALRAADAGVEVTLIEQSQLGGTCLNVGCIPSKALIEVASTHHRATNGPAWGRHASVELDMAGVRAHLRSVVEPLKDGVAALLADAGVTVVRGTAYFARSDRLSIETGAQVSHLEFDNAIVATGSRPIELGGFALSDRIVDSTGALDRDRLPRSAVVLGAGYIGVELGTAWAKLGCAVTLVDAADSILPAMAPELTRPVARHLRTLGVDIITGVTATAPTADGVELSDGRVIAADLIVVAVGRRPNSDRCSIDAAGVTTTDAGHVVVDANGRAAHGIYAIGDLTTDGPALAHRASADAERAVAAILGKPTVMPAAIPAVVFSDPEIVTVGATLDDASAQGLLVHRFPHGASARARTLEQPSGATYLVADDAGTVVGLHAVGPHVSELAGIGVLAIEMAATVEDLAHMVQAHPTMSETVGEAALVGFGSPLHIRRK